MFFWIFFSWTVQRLVSTKRSQIFKQTCSFQLRVCLSIYNLSVDTRRDSKLRGNNQRNLICLPYTGNRIDFNKQIFKINPKSLHFVQKWKKIEQETFTEHDSTILEIILRKKNSLHKKNSLVINHSYKKRYLKNNWSCETLITNTWLPH